MKDKIINFLDNKKILILGYGREGKSALTFIKNNLKNYEVAIADKNKIDTLEDVKVYYGDNYLDVIKDYDIVVQSPGVIIKDYVKEEDKKKITSLTDMFLRFTDNIVIGVTGTKGKSTTSSLIYHILKENNYNTYLIGNIGVPSFDVIDEIKEDTILVYELSCHQLEFAKKSPHISVLLNLYEEHLDHYISINEYIDAKKNIFKFQSNDDYLIYGDIFKYMTDYDIDKIVSKKFDINEYDDIKNEEIITSLIGDHNKTNIKFAILATSLVGVCKQKALEAVKTFKGLEHRLEYVTTKNDIIFYNDSIATAQEAVINAIKSLKEVNTLIVGGMDRGLDYSILVDYLKKSSVENIILLPDTNERIYKMFTDNDEKNVFIVNNMDEAVKVSFEYTKKNKICLLSPAAASYNVYKNFEKRGEHYKQLIEEYKNENC